MRNPGCGAWCIGCTTPEAMRRLLGLTFLMLAACSDDPAQTGPITLFKQVDPILATKCGDCHQVAAPRNGAIGFLGPDLENEYEVAIDSVFLVGDLTQNGTPLLTMVDVNKHENITYTDAEHTSIKAWLDAETKERYGADLATASTLADAAVKQWSGCLTKSDFDAAGMVAAWTGFTTVDGRHCTDCHDGQGNLPLAVSTDATTFFNAITMHRRLMVEYFTLGSSADQILPDTHSFDVTGNRKGPHVNHPMYVLNAGFTALKTWFQAASMKKSAGSCGPPVLVD